MAQAVPLLRREFPRQTMSFAGPEGAEWPRQGSMRSLEAHTRSGLVARVHGCSPFRWQADAGVDSVEDFRLGWSYRVGSVDREG